MRVLVVLLISSAVLSMCKANTLTDQLKVWGHNMTQTSNAIKNQLGDVKNDLVDLAKDRFKGLLSQSLQALAGAFASTFGKVFGKRDLSDIISEQIHNVDGELTDAFHSMFTTIGDVISDFVIAVPEIQPYLEQMKDDWEILVRQFSA